MTTRNVDTITIINEEFIEVVKGKYHRYLRLDHISALGEDEDGHYCVVSGFNFYLSKEQHDAIMKILLKEV